MQHPTIHLNGTSGRALFDQTVAAAHALKDALEVLYKSAPHGRDYYPQGSGAYEEARAEFLTRVKRVQSVIDELDEQAAWLVDHLHDN